MGIARYFADIVGLHSSDGRRGPETSDSSGHSKRQLHGQATGIALQNSLQRGQR